MDDSGERELNRAKNSAYRYLSFRPRSHAEVERKLAERGFSDAVIRQTLDHLDRLGYVNDRKFALQWARSRVRSNGFGRRRIEQELCARGVGRELIREALDETFQESPEIEIAQQAAGKKTKTLERCDPGTRMRRTAGFLERKGFSPDIIRSVLFDRKKS